MTEIVDLESEVGRFYPAPVAAVTASLVRATNPRPHAIERSHAHIVVVPVTGEGWHLVDFDRYPVSPGRAVHVQPGQVHRFDPDGTYEAIVAIIRSGVCPPGLFPPGEHHPAGELGSAAPIVVALVEDLQREQAVEAPSNSIMGATAQLLLRHIARATGSAPSADRSSQVGLLRAFREELERSYASARTVSYYASEIGTSPKTLSRTTAHLVGQSPKELIDERVAVEAKRLLVYTADPIATIGAGLGFSEATNFTKFFTRVVGVSPHDFRDVQAT